jgi:imidazoleglycerol phosphate synthase glutamine amidotransferase subunit HisH
MRQLDLRGKQLSKVEYKKLLPRGDFSVADAAVEKDGICAVQFHPGKSGKSGLALIKNWVDQL